MSRKTKFEKTRDSYVLWLSLFKDLKSLNLPWYVDELISTFHNYFSSYFFALRVPNSLKK